ncbi:MAG: hypothetical protein IIC35_06215 [Gemmatimonadetes bacterium]|nr:hypothetical protein [Gemmatimonadota bacterium]
MNPSRMLLIAAPSLLLSGCDIPSAAPIIEQRWILTVEETTLGVDELLPTSVTVSGSTFDISVDPVTAGASLLDMCPDCAALDGLAFEVPVPAFSGSFGSSQALPTEVISAEIVGGSISIQIDNGLSFDPLAGGGTIVIEVRNGSGGPLLGDLTLDGATEVLAPGGTVTRVLTLVAGTLDAPLVATTVVNVAGGQTTFVDVAETIDVVATVNSILVSSLTINVPGQTVTIDPIAVDLDDIDSDMADHIVQGAIILDVENPFAVSLNGDVDIGPTTKSFAISGAGTSRVSLLYTGDELRSFIGLAGATFSGSGTAIGSAVTIRPGQMMTIEVTLDLTIEIG